MSSAAARATDVAPGLSVRPREQWAGDERSPTGPLSTEDVRFLLVHHTASANGSDPIATMRSAYDFHTGPQRGWPDVAYNFFIDQFGVVWEGRAGSLDGPIDADATGGSQGFAQLVCLLGDFTSVLPTRAALAALESTLAWLAFRHGIDTAPGATTSFTSRGSNRWPAQTRVDTTTIAGHRDMSRTACPGDTLYPYLVEEIPGAVASIRTAWADAAIPTTTTTPSPTATTTPTTTTTLTTTLPGTTTLPSTTTLPTTTRLPGTTSTAVATAPSADAATDAAANAAAGDDSSTGLTVIGLGGLAVAGAGLWYTARRRNTSHEDRHQLAPSDEISQR